MTGLIVFCFVFLIGFFVFRNRNTNPYIKNHKAKWQNEKNYQEYLKWLNKTNPDIPFPEIKINHEIEISKQLDRTVNK